VYEVANRLAFRLATLNPLCLRSFANMNDCNGGQLSLTCNNQQHKMFFWEISGGSQNEAQAEIISTTFVSNK
jgi:hypothetical protein